MDLQSKSIDMFLNERNWSLTYHTKACLKLPVKKSEQSRLVSCCVFIVHLEKGSFLSQMLAFLSENIIIFELL